MNPPSASHHPPSIPPPAPPAGARWARPEERRNPPATMTAAGIAPASTPPATLIIGYGNTLRGDDAVGPIVAEAIGMLGQPGIETVICQQLTPELSVRIAAAQRVIFVDATAETTTRASSGPMAREIKAGSAGGPIVGHSGDPGVLLALAHGLFGHAPRAWLVTIPARHFELGGGLSPACADAIAPAVALVRRLCSTSP